MLKKRSKLSIKDFLAEVKEDTDLQNVFAIDAARSDDEFLYVEHWRPGIVKRISASCIRSVTPLGAYLNNDPRKPLVLLEMDSTLTSLDCDLSFFGDPHRRSVTLLDFPNPPGGSVDGAPVVEFFATVECRVKCRFSPLQPEPPRRPLERLGVLYKNRYYHYFSEFAVFTEASPTAVVNLDSYDYYWAMAFFTRPQGSSSPWRISEVSNIAVNDNVFTFTFIDIIFQGGTTGGEVKIESHADIVFP